MPEELGCCDQTGSRLMTIKERQRQFEVSRPEGAQSAQIFKLGAFSGSMTVVKRLTAARWSS